MSPRAFLANPAAALSARSLLRASSAPLGIRRGDVVGVVLMNLGGPTAREEVEPFLYSRLMDPAEIRLRFPHLMRHYWSAFEARRRSKSMGEAYAQIGGRSPITRHSEEQARALEKSLNEQIGAACGASFRTYVAMRHSQPSSEKAAARMAVDGVNKVVFLPLHPHYAASTTGSSLAYWKALESTGEIPTWESTTIPEYAAHPKYVRALADRVDEGLQRFSREIRDRVQVVFTAHGALRPMDSSSDPYCCLVHATVSQVLADREEADPNRQVHVVFQRPLAGRSGIEPDLCDRIEEIADGGGDAVLVVPVSFVSDRVESAYEFDVLVRKHALDYGLEHFEVSNGLNCHPLFIEGLAECVAAHLVPLEGASGDGAMADVTVPRSPRSPASQANGILCATCQRSVEPHIWEPAAGIGNVEFEGTVSIDVPAEKGRG